MAGRQPSRALSCEQGPVLRDCMQSLELACRDSDTSSASALCYALFRTRRISPEHAARAAVTARTTRGPCPNSAPKPLRPPASESLGTPGIQSGSLTWAWAESTGFTLRVEPSALRPPARPGPARLPAPSRSEPKCPQARGPAAPPPPPSPPFRVLRTRPAASPTDSGSHGPVIRGPARRVSALEGRKLLVVA